MSKRALAWWCASMLWLVACGGDDDAPANNITRDEKVVGPDGAVLALSDGAKVEIPAGALLEPVTIVIREVDEPKPLPNNLSRASKHYAFEPHGTLFAEPVKITLPYDDEAGDENEERPIKLDDEQDDTWQTLVGADKVESKLELEVLGFSFYVVARPNRSSGVITLPDGATYPIDAGRDATVTMPDASMLDAMVSPDATITDAGRDAVVDDAGDATVASFFQDPDLELEVRRTLGLATGPITQQHLDSLTSLSTGISQINSLVGLERCPNLTDLVVPVAALADLTPIADLPLTALTLHGFGTTAPLSQIAAIDTLRAIELWETNMVGSLADLSTLTSLTMLRIAYSDMITGNISALAPLNALETLTLQDMQVAGDIAVFADAVSISHLDVSLSPNVTGDLASLSGLSSLALLHAHSSGVIGNLSSLAGLTQLFGLSLSNTAVTGNLSSLSGTQMMRLYLAYTSVTGALASLSSLTALDTLDLAGLSGVTGSLADVGTQMGALTLSGTSVTGTLSTLTTRIGLYELRLDSTLVSGDVSTLSPLMFLSTIDLSSSNVSGDLTSFASHAVLQVLRLENTSVTLDFSALVASSGAHVIGEIWALGSPIDCPTQDPLIETLRGVGSTIATSCDPID